MISGLGYRTSVRPVVVNRFGHDDKPQPRREDLPGNEVKTETKPRFVNNPRYLPSVWDLAKRLLNPAPGEPLVVNRPFTKNLVAKLVIVPPDVLAEANQAVNLSNTDVIVVREEEGQDKQQFWQDIADITMKHYAGFNLAEIPSDKMEKKAFWEHVAKYPENYVIAVSKPLE